jgi:peptidyl-dipeptidase A
MTPAMKKCPPLLPVTFVLVHAIFAPHAGAATKLKKGTAAEAKAFVQKVDADLRRLWVRGSTADWIRATYITDDTERNAAVANEEIMAYIAEAQKTAARFVGVKVAPETDRMLTLLRVAAVLPAPSDAKKRAELAELTAKLEGMYGKGKYCKNGDPKQCKTLDDIEDILAKSRNYDELLDLWTGWHAIARPMRPMFQRLVELTDEGSREVGFSDTGAVWRSSYDMPPDDFSKETERLWQQVRPLYEQLHCYVRAQLMKTYGGKIPAKGPIPAHLLGNMWAQDWSNIYSLVEPYKGQGSLDVTEALKKQNYDPTKLVKLAESFFTSMGLDPLPATFWQRSMFVKPHDREVVCHASAWDVQFDNDLRIKVCIKINEENLITLHHELGHDYYFHYYYKLPILFQQGANDGFHEAIGDALTLSITPSYLKKLGLIQSAPTDQKGLINFQMKDALEKIAFLPFGLLVDQWRWDVFSGKTKPENYNKAWWTLREKLQGVAPAVPRGESEFDPGAKFHVPGNTPYMRYFLARILQFQFHRAMCKAAGWTGPLHECSIYGNKAAGDKLRAMLSLGASKPWQEALYAMTGEKQMDASAILDYFAPLAAWLKEQNKGQVCGW